MCNLIKLQKGNTCLIHSDVRIKITSWKPAEKTNGQPKESNFAVVPVSSQKNKISIHLIQQENCCGPVCS
jgi:hypothetical protein